MNINFDINLIKNFLNFIFLTVIIYCNKVSNKKGFLKKKLIQAGKVFLKSTFF